MAKRRVKKRTHVGAKIGAAASKPGSRVPKSMVIRVGAGEVGQSVSQLVKDVRSMMEPHTASRLKERRGNKLRDFTTMAGPLGVSHLLLFSKSETGNVNMRLALTPRGPTLHFRVAKYSLRKDIFQSMKRPKSTGDQHITPPLLVMNNFTSQPTEPETESTNSSTPNKIPKHLETLTTSVFQSLFPPINPTTTSLKSIKRILLLDRIPTPSNSPDATYTLHLRHYAIETRTAKSVPKPLRRLDAASQRLAHTQRKRNAIPNLGRLTDVSDYLLDPDAADGFTSGSESEPETDAEVEIVASGARKAMKPSRRRDGEDGNGEGGKERRRERKVEVERKAIKLHELGPRMRLRLTKVEEGVCGGKVMWHEYIQKTKEEVKEMERVHERRRQEKERRKAEQKANVERKKAEKKARGKDGEADDEDEEEVEFDEEMDDGDDQWDEVEDLDEDDVVDDGSEDEEMDDAG